MIGGVCMVQNCNQTERMGWGYQSPESCTHWTEDQQKYPMSMDKRYVAWEQCHRPKKWCSVCDKLRHGVPRDHRMSGPCLSEVCGALQSQCLPSCQTGLHENRKRAMCVNDGRDKGR